MKEVASAEESMAEAGSEEHCGGLRREDGNPHGHRRPRLIKNVFTVSNRDVAFPISFGRMNPA